MKFKFATALFCTLILSGCASPQFTISRADDRFTENKNPVYVSENNRLSNRSLAGGTHIDDKGVFINPYVEQNADGTTKQIGLIVLNRGSVDTWSGNRLRLGAMQQVVFRLDDGSLVRLRLTGQEVATPGVATYNSLAKYAELAFIESGRALISPADFARLARSQTVSVKITGAIQTAVFEEKDIQASFLDNLRVFQEQHVR